MKLLRWLKTWLAGGLLDIRFRDTDLPGADVGCAPLPPVIPQAAIDMLRHEPVATTRVKAVEPLRGSLRDRVQKRS